VKKKLDHQAQVDLVIDQMMARPTFAGRNPARRRRVLVGPTSPETPLFAMFGSMAPQIEKGIELARTETGQKALAGAAVALAAILLPRL
jgi:hypothetical protein